MSKYKRSIWYRIRRYNYNRLFRWTMVWAKEILAAIGFFVLVFILPYFFL